MESNLNDDVKKEKKRLINSFKYAGQGIMSAFKSERNMKIHLAFMIAVIIFGIIFKLSRI